MERKKKLWLCQKEQSTETHESRQDSNADAGDHCLVFQNKPCRQWWWDQQCRCVVLISPPVPVNYNKVISFPHRSIITTFVKNHHLPWSSLPSFPCSSAPSSAAAPFPPFKWPLPKLVAVAPLPWMCLETKSLPLSRLRKKQKQPNTGKESGSVRIVDTFTTV